MSKTTKRVTRTSEYEQVTETKCDLCGKTFPGDNWPTIHGGDNVCNTEVSMEHGWNYGSDGGDIAHVEFDVCPWCFNDILIPFFAEHGAKPRIYVREF